MIGTAVASDVPHDLGEVLRVADDEDVTENLEVRKVCRDSRNLS